VNIRPFDKFQIPSTYVTPNECIGCGTSDNGNITGESPGMLDLAKDIDYYGALYICSRCSLQVGKAFGAITPEQFESMERALKEANEELSQLRRENLGLKKVIDGYREYGSLVTGDFNSTIFASLEKSDSSSELISGSDDSIEPEEQEETTEPSAELTGSDGSGVSKDTGGSEGSGDSEINESANLEGPGDVRNDSESDPLSDLLRLNT
jgi:hypothetical protein